MDTFDSVVTWRQPNSVGWSINSLNAHPWDLILNYFYGFLDPEESSAASFTGPPPKGASVESWAGCTLNHREIWVIGITSLEWEQLTFRLCLQRLQLRCESLQKSGSEGRAGSSRSGHLRSAWGLPDWRRVVMKAPAKRICSCGSLKFGTNEQGLRKGAGSAAGDVAVVVPGAL